MSGVRTSRWTPFGSILDVDGIGVGHHQRTGSGWQTGTTVITAPNGATPGVDVRGGGPGTRETDALRPENLIQQIHAVTLTGGSAYGLAAATGVVDLLEERGLGFPIAEHVVPVVPAAVIFDVGRSGDFGHRPDSDFGRRAARSALAGRTPPSWGSVGAGTGARAGGLQGGVGTASATVEIGDHAVTVGAVAVVNANGAPVDPSSGLPWETHGLRFRRPSRAERDAVANELTAQRGPALNTTIGLIATSAALDKAECSKVATVAHDGLARAIRPAHSMTDGDTVFTLATGDVALPEHDGGPDRIVALNAVLSAAADVFSAACTHAVLAASTIGTAVAWLDLCPNTLDSC
ncbi:P1 family peptidase [Ilumatobacter nonamiensis]|uniref:P1 family peptidase n=1 Tax=Ilumatobacter nonamiensis TaxID=467093 RepID=UPI0003463A43|nr:P1 family peptidase [Ilumatobacter nonamiensis]